MAAKRLFVVVGATGTQGGAVISHFLSHEPNYKIRGLTRNTKSSKAVAFAGKGVEMIQAELGDLESLKTAFSGANTIFAYTDFDGAGQSKEAAEAVKAGKAKHLAEAAEDVEFNWGKNIADAAASTADTLERLVFTTTPNAKRLAKGELATVHEFQGKANAQKYMQSLPALKGKASFVTFSIFADSIPRFPEILGLTKKSEGHYVCRLPNNGDAPLAWIDMPNDAGSWISSLLKAPAGIHVEGISEWVSTNDLLAVVAEKHGITVEVEKVTVEEFERGDDQGIMRDIALLFIWNEVMGIKSGDENVITAEKFKKQGWGVKTSSVREAIRKMDWQPLL